MIMPLFFIIKHLHCTLLDPLQRPMRQPLCIHVIKRRIIQRIIDDRPPQQLQKVNPTL